MKKKQQQKQANINKKRINMKKTSTLSFYVYGPYCASIGTRN